MKLTQENFKVFAARYYENGNCISQDEFDEDLTRISTIMRMLSRYSNGETVNVLVLLNNVIMFYNVFNNHAATELLEMKLDTKLHELLNSILHSLHLPTIGKGHFDEKLFRDILKATNIR